MGGVSATRIWSLNHPQNTELALYIGVEKEHQLINTIEKDHHLNITIQKDHQLINKNSLSS